MASWSVWLCCELEGQPRRGGGGGGCDAWDWRQVPVFQPPPRLHGMDSGDEDEAVFQSSSITLPLRLCLRDRWK